MDGRALTRSYNAGRVPSGALVPVRQLRDVLDTLDALVAAELHELPRMVAQQLADRPTMGFARAVELAAGAVRREMAAAVLALQGELGVLHGQVQQRGRHGQPIARWLGDDDDEHAGPD